MSMEQSDKEAAAVAVAPRVALADIEGAIIQRYDMTAFDAVTRARGDVVGVREELKILTLCICVMSNGWVVVGKSAPASPANFSPTLGKKYAYDDCLRQLWPLMGFSLKDKLAEGEPDDPPGDRDDAAGE